MSSRTAGTDSIVDYPNGHRAGYDAQAKEYHAVRRAPDPARGTGFTLSRILP
jgi:hypothetical protein